VTDVVHELVVIKVAAEKLGVRGISQREVEQIIDNRFVIARNPRRNRRSANAPHVRRLLTGLTNGGRALTLVIERAVEPTTWLVVTGWTATKAGRKMLDS
jgi:hypothetical protein